MSEQVDVQIEAEIVELSKAIHEQGIVESSKEALRAAIGEKLSKLPPITQAESRPPQIPSNPAPSSLPSYASQVSSQAQMKAEQLLDMAVHKGIVTAMRHARGSDPLTMKLFHDAITEKLYEKFKAQGLIS